MPQASTRGRLHEPDYCDALQPYRIGLDFLPEHLSIGLLPHEFDELRLMVSLKRLHETSFPFGCAAQLTATTK